MITTIPSNRERFRIRLKIVSKRPFHLGIRLYNPLYPSSYYFRRKAFFKESGAKREFVISMPVSPKSLEMEIYDKNSSNDEIIDLGSGFGTLSIFLASKLQEKHITAYELSFVPWAISVILKKILNIKNLTI